jgi:hypothetical protein
LHPWQSNGKSEQYLSLEQIGNCGTDSTPTNKVTIPPQCGGIDAISTLREPVLASATIEIAICADKPIEEQGTLGGRRRVPDNRGECQDLLSMHGLELGTAAHAPMFSAPRNPGRTSLLQGRLAVGHDISAKS